MWESHIFLKKLNYYRSVRTEKPFIILEKILDEPENISELKNIENIIYKTQNSTLDTKMETNKETLTFTEDEWSNVVTEDFGMDNCLAYNFHGTEVYYVNAPIKDTSTHTNEADKIDWTERPTPNIWDKYRELADSTAKNKPNDKTKEVDSSPASVITPVETSSSKDDTKAKKELFQVS